MKQINMNLVDWSVLALVIVGAINWGLVGLGHFLDMNLNLVNAILGSVPTAEFAVYLLVGLAGLYAIYFATRIAGVDVEDTDTEMGERTAPR
jgi:uncharacterized membrane protein YuzA (DUF378 family)